MPTNYLIDVYDTAGTLQAILTDFTSMSYRKEVNGPGLLRIKLSAKNPITALLSDKWIFDVWRKPEGSDWVLELSTLYRDARWRYQNFEKIELVCPGVLSMLGWRIVAWYADTTNRSKFIGAKAETIAKILVNYNAASLATIANGRLAEGAITGLSVQADAATGNTIDWYCAYENLLTSLQDLALSGGGDFNLVKTGNAAWDFRWYNGQLGTDRTATVTFAMERGNMSNPKYNEDYRNEKTLVIVGGKGEKTERLIEVVTSSNYHVTSNHTEVFTGATDVDTVEGLQTRGNQKLMDAKVRKEFEFDVLQTPSTQYGGHYNLGDLVKAINPYNGTVYTQKISAINVNVESGGAENVTVEVQNV